MDEENNQEPPKDSELKELQIESEPGSENFGDKLRNFVRPLYVKIILSFIGIFILLWIIVTMCSSPPPVLQKRYVIAMDPSWYPLQNQIKQRNMTAFCESLLREIINDTDIHIDIIQNPPDRLFADLKNEKCDGVISLLLPAPSRGYSFLFSSPIYRIGSVLVTHTADPVVPIEEMSGSLIGLVGEARMSTDIDRYPSVIFTGYDDIARAFADLNNYKVDGLITDSVNAKDFVSGYYGKTVHIAYFLKENEGIRLILRDNKLAEFFLHFFNKKLAELREDGTYANLLEMWKIPPE